MIDNPNPVFWTYEADVHCPACAEARFGAGLYRQAKDREGNRPHPVWMPTDNPPSGTYCGDCHREILSPWLPDGYEVWQYAGDEVDALWYWRGPAGIVEGQFASEDAALRDCVSEISW